MRYFFEIFSDCLTPSRIARWSSRFGLHDKTVQAWTRPVESDEFPTGTGKKSFADHVEFILRDVYKTHPAEAREIAARYQAIIEDLDRAAGSQPATDEVIVTDAVTQNFAKVCDAMNGLIKGSLQSLPFPQQISLLVDLQESVKVLQQSLIRERNRREFGEPERKIK